MDEQERILLTDIASREQLSSNGFRATWDSLQRFAASTSWGRSNGGVTVSGADPWVLRAEVSR